MDSNTLLLFVDVVEAGSLAAAARRTGVPKSTISRKLRELEEHLGVKLLHRTTRQLGLTDAGRRLLGHAQEMVEVIARARTELAEDSGAVRGVLRVTASVSLAEHVLSTLLVEFAARYPEVTLDLVLDAARTDLISEAIDVAIRVGAPDPASPLIARRLAEAALYPCASPGYLARHPAPESPAELSRHAAIVYRAGELPTELVLEREDSEVHRIRPRARLTVNSHLFARAAAIGGLGVAVLPANFLRPALESGELVRLLPEYRTPLRWVYAAFVDRQLSAAARAFVDFVAERIDPAIFRLA